MSAAIEQPSSSRPQILVLDDDAAQRLLMRTLLEAEGYVVKTAASGVEALEAVVDTVFDAAIIDITMPNKDGSMIAHILRGAQPHVHVCVTAASGERDLQASFGGYDAFFHEPVDWTQLVTTLALLLDRPSRHDTPSH